MINKLMTILLAFLVVSCNKPSKEELYTTEVLEKLNEKLESIAEYESYRVEMQTIFMPTLNKVYLRNIKLFYGRLKEAIEKDSGSFDEFTDVYNKAMDSITDLANSNKFMFYMENVEPVTKLLPKSNTTSIGDRDLLIAKMKNDVLVNTISVIRFYNYQAMYRSTFTDTKVELEIDTTGLATTKTFKLKMPGIRFRDTLNFTRDMITITENGEDITNQVEFEVFDYDPDIVGIVEMNTTEPGDYEFSGTLDIYFKRKEFVLHQPFNFKFTIK